MRSVNPLIGKTIIEVYLADDKQAIKFDVLDGEPIIAKTDGECCSVSWIEDLDMPLNLIGTVVSVKDISMPDLGATDTQESVAYYGCMITTNKGSCVIDYRNESNGYYGGNLSWPGDFFYGGEYGQNVSNETWKKIV